MRHRVPLLGTWIDRVDLSEAGVRIVEFVRSRSPHQLITANTDFLRLADRDSEFRDLVNTSDMVVADGMPLVWASRLLGDALPQRIAGVDLVVESARRAEEHGFRIYLLGAGPGVAEGAAAVLAARFPQLCIAGTYSPPFGPMTPEQDAEIVARVRGARPDMLFVAFGAPTQDRWIRSHMEALGVPVCMGVGGTFDMLAGRVRRAPIWMQKRGLEWTYRLLQEPGRLWKRYLIHDMPVFIRLIISSRRYAAMTMPERYSIELKSLLTSDIRSDSPDVRVVDDAEVHVVAS